MKHALKYALISGLCLLPAMVAPAYASGGSSPDKIDKAASRITGSPQYVLISGLNVPIANWDGFSGLMAMDIGLEIEDDHERQRIQHTMPIVRDALRRTIHVYMNASYVADSVPDLEELGKRLQRIMDKSLGDNVAQVTIASAIIHPY